MPPRTLAVIGQGYVGLPLAMRAVQAGYRVVGVEVDAVRAQKLASGISYVEDISSTDLQAALDSGRYLPSSGYAACADFDIAVVTVPTPLNEGAPDLSFIEAAARSLAPHLQTGATVILESTTYPGTTEEFFGPILAEGSGLIPGVDFFLGYSPERIDPGNPSFGLANTPKVVSGVSAQSLQVITAFFDDIVERTVAVSSPKVAELTKLLENTFRHVNIALVNELAIFANALGINVWEAIDAASTKPFGYLRFTPGPGVGGHCLPIDPSYLSWQVKRTLGQNFRFVELANDVNDHMPDYVVQRATAILNSAQKAVNGSTILLAGLAYKRNTGDARESPAVRVLELLSNLGARLHVADPHVDWELSHLPRPTNVERVDLTAEAVSRADLVILLVDHDDFDLDVLRGSKAVLDTRNVLAGPNVEVL